MLLVDSSVASVVKSFSSPPDMILLLHRHQLLKPLVLTHIQVVIEAAQRQQFIVRTALDDPMVVDHQHLVGIANRAQSGER